MIVSDDGPRMAVKSLVAIRSRRGGSAGISAYELWEYSNHTCVEFYTLQNIQISPDRVYYLAAALSSVQLKTPPLVHRRCKPHQS